MNKILQYATEFVTLGISVIPLHHRSKKVDVSLTSGTWEQYTTASNTEYELSRWLGSGWLNYGVVAGWGNLVVIDFDSMFYFEIWKLWAASQPTYTQYVVANSFKVLTRRGVHVYITTKEPIANGKRIAKEGGIDIQAQRKYVVGPGSAHPNGHVYEPIGEMVFSCVSDIESVLPIDLFPLVVAEPETGSMPPVEITTQHTEYDAYQSAMGQGLDLISKVKRAVRIETFFADASKSSADGRWYKTICPFHDDKNPSAWIDLKRQLFGCQVCGFKPMDAINIYSRMHNVTESAAVTMMAREVGVWG